jgi:heparanase
MGSTVLDVGPSHPSTLYLYAHCLRDWPGGVALLAINLDRSKSQPIELATSAERYTLSAKNLQDTRLKLNGSDLRLGADDAIPQLSAVATNSGTVTFESATITFLAIRNANNANCR